MSSALEVELLGIVHIDFIEETEDSILLRPMVSLDDIYYKNNDATGFVELSPYDGIMGHLKIT